MWQYTHITVNVAISDCDSVIGPNNKVVLISIIVKPKLSSDHLGMTENALRKRRNKNKTKVADATKRNKDKGVKPAKKKLQGAYIFTRNYPFLINISLNALFVWK